MTRAAITACWPWVLVLVGLVLAAHFLVRLSNARLRLARLRHLHGDQAGSVQSLSFVLTLPIFIMVVMLIVQVSQLMIGLIVVHYAAYAAARSAAVWIPANLPVAGGRQLPQQLHRRCGGRGPGGAGGESGVARFRPVRGRPDLLGRTGERQVQQDRLGGDPGVHADFALARPRASAPNEATTAAVLKEVYSSVAPSSQPMRPSPGDWITSWPMPTTTPRSRFVSSTRTRSRR